MARTPEYYYQTQTEIHNFCKTETMDSAEIENRQKYFVERLANEVFEKRENRRDRFQQLLDLHSDRLRKEQTFSEFKNQILPAPQVRMGLLIYTLQMPDYAFIKQIAETNQLSVQACTDVIFDNEYSEYCTEDGYIAEMWISFKELKPSPHIFRDLNLKKLNYLCISQFPEEVLDLSGLKSQFLRKLIIQSEQFVKTLILAGTPQELEIHFMRQLEKVDMTAMSVLDLHTASLRWSNKNCKVACTEAQYHYSEPLRKLKGKKEILPTTTSELDFYGNLHDWEIMEMKFVNWVIKHPLCDKGTALSIYWQSNPEYYTEFSHKENLESINSEMYKLLKVIEKNFAKNFYQKAEIPFDPAIVYQNSNFKLPEKMLTPIPPIMFEKLQ